MTTEERLEALERRVAELDGRTFMFQRLGPKRPYDPDPDGKLTGDLIAAIEFATKGEVDALPQRP